MDWKTFWNGEHSIYAGPKHLAAHYRRIADDMISVIPSDGAVVLDYGCGEALEAQRVAGHCKRLILFEAVDGLRERVAARHAGAPRITVMGPDDLAAYANGSVDLAVVNSVLQYLTPAQLDRLLADTRRLLRPDGLLVIADVIRPGTSAIADVGALLGFARANGFLGEALTGLARTALSDYAKLRRDLGLATYSSEALVARLAGAGFAAKRRAANLGMNPARMTFLARPV